MTQAARGLVITASLALLSCAGGGASTTRDGEAALVGQSATTAAAPSCDVGTDSEWRPIATASAPTFGNNGYKAVWTAHGMVVIRDGGGGGVYDPCADQWRPIEPSRDALTTGSMLQSDDALVFITDRAHPVRTSVFDIRSTAWRRLPESPNHLGAHAAVAWTGKELFVWGGVVSRPKATASGHPSMDTSEGAILDSATGAWRAVSPQGAPAARAKAVAVWTGKSFIVWGGASHATESGMLCPHSFPAIESGCIYRPNGAAYDPATDQWRALPTEGAPSRMIDPAMVWTGTVVLLWDQVLGNKGNPLYALDPAVGRWRTLGDMPRAYYASSPPIVGGRLVLLDQAGGHLFDIATGRWAEIQAPNGLMRCLQPAAVEPDRMVFLAPAYCHRGTVAVVTFEPRANAWKSKDLPRVPIDMPGVNPSSAMFNGLLVWTGAHVIGWGGAYGNGGGPTGCENPPPGVGCDPVASPTTPTNKGFLIKPAL